MDPLTLIFGLLIGALIGGILMSIVAHARRDQAVAEAVGEIKASEAAARAEARSAEARIADLQSRLAAVEQELTAAQLQMRDQNILLSEGKASLKEQSTIAQRVPALELELVQREQEFKAVQGELTRLRADEATFNARIEELRRAQEQLKQAFTALSADALKNNNEMFLQLAKTEIEKQQTANSGELEKRHKAFEELLKPLREGLDKYDQKVVQFEKDRVESYGALTTQLKHVSVESERLKQETANLVKALRAPTVRGRWGEMQLKRVAELAGMLEYCDFFTQDTVTIEGGVLRPDMTVRLAGGKLIVVDAKAPLMAYLEALEAPDEPTRQARLKDHARQIRTHLSQLSTKRYWDQMQQTFQQTPELVVMFIPGETFYSAALEQDPQLIEEGVHQRVVLATPTTLIALLRAIAYGWQQERIAENAQEISQRGKELYERLATLNEHFTRMGKSLDSAVDAYNKTVGALETRVLPTARKFKELGATTGDDIETPVVIDRTARELQAPELKPNLLEQP